MRTSHDTLDNSKASDSHENENNGLSADRVHTTSAHIPLREHVSVPMPPRRERATLMPLLNVETVATELHVERQAPDPDKLHEYDGAELLYDRHSRDKAHQKEVIEGKDEDPEATTETDEDSDSEEDAETTQTVPDSVQPKLRPLRRTLRTAELFQSPLADLTQETASSQQPDNETAAAEGQAATAHQDQEAAPQNTSPLAEQQPVPVTNAEYQWPDIDEDTTAPLPPIGTHSVHAKTAFPPFAPQKGGPNANPGQPNTTPNTSPNTVPSNAGNPSNASPNSPNTANQPPTPPFQGNQPPQPPTGPPTPPNFNGYPMPGQPNPNVPLPYNPNYPAPGLPAYNQAPSASYNTAPQPPQYMGPRKGIDTLARLGVVGNFIGNHRTRKRLGKQMAQNQRQTNANFADIQAQQLRFDQSQRRQDRDLREIQQRTAGQPAANQYRSPQAPAAPETSYAMPAANQELSAPAYAGFAPQAARPDVPGQATVGAAEQRFAANPARPEEAQPNVSPEQPVTLQPNQHVEQSAWHNIVVNERGQEVPGAITYGEGFQRERQQEIIPDHVGGGLGISSHQQQYGAPGTAQGGAHPGALPSGMTAPTLPQGNPALVDAQHQLPARTKNSGVPGLAFWIMLAIIIAAFFAAAFI